MHVEILDMIISTGHKTNCSLNEHQQNTIAIKLCSFEHFKDNFTLHYITNDTLQNYKRQCVDFFKYLFCYFE
jgi:hypothetical protein